jgi:hypothetical protein
MKDYERAAEAFRAAISFNPNFPEAHLVKNLLKDSKWLLEASVL